MTSIARMMVLICLIPLGALAQKPYQEIDEIPALSNFVAGTMIALHGIVEKAERDGASANTFLLVLEGGLKCRISMDQAKIKSKDRNRKGLKFTTRGMNSYVLEFDGEQIFSQGTDVIVRGTLKKGMSTLLLDKAVVRGCSEKAVRKAFQIDCGGPCSTTHYWSNCNVCK